MNDTAKSKSPWSWIPTLYFTEGLPYVVVMSVSVIMYKNLGVSNTDIALYTSLLYLPWVIKPIWSPVIDLIKKKRWWTWTMQMAMAAGFVGVAFALFAQNYFILTLAFLWVLAISSATHDIAADGFYMLALSDDQQAFFVGIRSTFYRLAMISGEGLFVILAGLLATSTGSIPLSWTIVFGIIAAMMLLLSIYHAFILPRPDSDVPVHSEEDTNYVKEFIQTFALFFKKEKIGLILAFILLYRFGEAQLVKLAAPFLLDAPAVGGLGLTTTEVGVINGTIGVIALVIGGILGGIVISRNGLKYWLWPMIVAMNIPNLVYVILAYLQPENFILISGLVGLEKLGYGFGFAAFLMYLIYVARGSHKTAHYAFATGLMALGMMVPGLFSGWIQEMLGYKLFFVWVMIATIPAFIVARYVELDPEFGKKKDQS